LYTGSVGNPYVSWVPRGLDAGRICNRDLHVAILLRAKDSYLTGMMGTIRLQNKNAEGYDLRLRLTVGTWVSGAQQLVESIGTREAANGERVKERHVFERAGGHHWVGARSRCRTRNVNFRALVPHHRKHCLKRVHACARRTLQELLHRGYSTGWSGSHRHASKLLVSRLTQFASRRCSTSGCSRCWL
jgi:hypothetical protein